MTADNGGDVLVERHDGVLLLRLNRPQRHNAIGGTMLRDLAAAFDEAAGDDSVHVVVTTGSSGTFCVGADAADLGPGFAPIGLTAELGLSYLLPRLVGSAVAADLLFTDRLVDAGEAKELGLVTETVPDDRLLDRAMEVAQRISSMPPLGVQSSKRLLRRSVHGDLAAQLRAEHAAQLVLFDHPDTQAALDRLADRTGR